MVEKGGRAMLWAFGLWGIWTLGTWWFEGRIETFRRPEAVLDRLIYTGVVNVLVGVLGAALILRGLFRGDGARLRFMGFGGWPRTLVAVPVGFALGIALYFVQGAPSADPIVMLNAYSQVFVVSMAEVMVCWSLIGGTVALGAHASRRVSVPVAILAASILFGIYHFAHSAPFNTIGMVAFLSVIGLITGAFYFVSLDLYATIIFHNFLGTFGVVQALAANGQIDAFRTPQAPLIATAVVALVVLLAADRFVVRAPS